MPDRFSLVRWRDAKTNPPEEGTAVWTDVGLRTYMEWRVFDHPEDDGDDGMLVLDWWQDDGIGSVEVANPRPSVWCDPSPPGDDAPTSDDLREAVECVEAEAQWNRQANPPDHYDADRLDAMAARLRRAIEEAER